MNRAMKRSMQRKQAEKISVPVALDNQKFVQHIEKKKAMNEGMTIGFIACMELLKESATSVHGIGEKRLEGILRALEAKLIEYREKLHI